MAKVAEKVSGLIKEAVEECGVKLWNVVFVKEGASHYLRVFIDKDEGISIDDCTNVSHAIDPIIDAADPIDCPYYLEVCSPGVERELTKEEHFTAMIGKNVKIRLFSAKDGARELCGKLLSYGDGVTLLTESGEVTVEKSQIAKANSADI